jgi:hypothetical protein
MLPRSEATVDEPQVIADTWSAGTGTGLAQGDTVILRCHGLPLLTIYTVILLSLLSISVKVTVLPWATLHRSSPAPSRRSRRQVRDSGARRRGRYRRSRIANYY